MNESDDALVTYKLSTTNRVDFGSDVAPPLTNQKSNKNAKMWAVQGDGFIPCDLAVDKLPAGQYIVRNSNSIGIHFMKKEVNLDNLLVLPDNNSAKVIAGIENFWSREQYFRDFGFLWKRGVLLYGPPGSGKTSTVQQLASLIIKKGGLAIYSTDPYLDAEGLRLLRRLEPTRPIVVIFEDIDAIIRHHGESNLLAMLDGELQVDNVVFIATTNYPEVLDARIKNRPSRFDEVIKIGMPNAECRKAFFEAKNPRLKEDSAELARWVDKTEGYSIAHLKEVIVSVECLAHTFEETVIRIEQLSRKISSDEPSASFGFAVSAKNGEM